MDLLLADLATRLADADLTLELTPAARALIAREGHDPAFGARPLKRTIQRLVENPLARALLQGEFQPGDRIVADADVIGGTIVFTTDRSTVGGGQRTTSRCALGRPNASRRRREGRPALPMDLPEIDAKSEKERRRARQLRLAAGAPKPLRVSMSGAWTP